MRLARGVDIDEAAGRLTTVVSQLEKLRSPGSTEYLAWADECETQLRGVFVEPDNTRLLHTDRYRYLYQHEEADDKWVNTNIPVPDPSGQEAATQLARLLALAAQVEQLRVLAQRPGRVMVYDTNSLMHYLPPNQIDWKKLLTPVELVRLVVPLVVVDELDRKKYAGTEKMSARATAALRALDRMLDGAAPGASVLVPGRAGVALEVLLDEDGHTRAVNADDEIIERAILLAQVTRNLVTVITADTGMRLRAQAAGLDTLRLDGHAKDQPDGGTS